MCQIKSAIVLQNKIYCPLDTDHHTDMLEKLGVKDDRKNPDFVRVKMVPVDGNIFNHDLANWKLRVDQDFRPEWFCLEAEEEAMKPYLEEFFEKRFVIERTVEEINKGRWFLKNGIVRQTRGNSKIEQMRESSHVGKMWERSYVGEMWESSHVGEMWERSYVGEMRGSSYIGEMRGSSYIGKMRESSTARRFNWNEKTKLYIPKGSFEIIEVEPKEYE